MCGCLFFDTTPSRTSWFLQHSSEPTSVLTFRKHCLAHLTTPSLHTDPFSPYSRSCIGWKVCLPSSCRELALLIHNYAGGSPDGHYHANLLLTLVQARKMESWEFVLNMHRHFISHGILVKAKEGVLYAVATRISPPQHLVLTHARGRCAVWSF